MSSRLPPNNWKTVASGLRFPEGPIVLPDASLLVVEIERQTLTRIAPDGSISMVAHLGGGPNGAAMGPDGACYICNNGGFKYVEEPGLLRPILQADDYSGGSIQRVDLSTGTVTTLYRGTKDRPLKGPNDLVFDAKGNFWFTDMGKGREHDLDRSVIYYASIDGTMLKAVIEPMMTANGIGLSRDGKKLYVSETISGRVWEFDINGVGTVDTLPWPSPNGGTLLFGSSNYQLFDSMAIEENGNLCVGTLINGGISVISPAGELVEFIPTPDKYATNICFGGPDMTTAYITLSTTGQVVSTKWPRPGAALHF